MTLHSSILFAALLGLQAVDASTITVTSTADSGQGTLRAALLTAGAGDTIDFALPTPAKIALTSGQLVVSNGVSILGPGPSNLLVDGGHQSSVFAVQFPFGATNNAVTISGLTITNGYARSGSGGGGGLWNQSAILTVSNCVLAGNHSDEGNGGGAVFNGGQFQLINSTVKDNTAFRSGGGICSLGSISQETVLLITNCTFTGNSASSGGAIYSSDELLWVANSVVSDNSAWYGGGIVNYAYGTTATLILVQSSVNRNTAFPDVVGCSWAGGILNEASGSAPSRANLAIIDSTIEGNVAPDGAGIWNYALGGTTYVGITNSTVSGNAAFCDPDYEECHGSQAGGGIFNWVTRTDQRCGESPGIHPPGTGTVYVVNSTLAHNTSARFGSGSGVHVEGTGGAATVVVASSVFGAGSSNGPMFRIVGSGGSVTSLGHNICSDSGSGYLTNATDQINTDPMLGSLQDNGGPTLTHALLPGSPAIDKGGNFSGSTNDQRALARTVNIAGIPNARDGTDVGAIESQDARLRLVNSGVVSNRLGFNLIGPFSSVVVEASTTLSNWTALATNTMTDEPLRLYPSAEQSQLFYRARLYSPWDY